MRQANGSSANVLIRTAALILVGWQTASHTAVTPEGEMTLALAVATPASEGRWSQVLLGFDNTSLVPYHVARMESDAAERAQIVHSDGSRSAGFVIPPKRFFVTGLGFPRLQLEGLRRRLAPGDTIKIALIGPQGRLNVEVRVRDVATDPAKSQPLNHLEKRT